MRQCSETPRTEWIMAAFRQVYAAVQPAFSVGMEHFDQGSRLTLTPSDFTLR